MKQREGKQKGREKKEGEWNSNGQEREGRDLKRMEGRGREMRGRVRLFPVECDRLVSDTAVALSRGAGGSSGHLSSLVLMSHHCSEGMKRSLEKQANFCLESEALL
jgi:hypothetical protein